jgi:hypothetical protein
MQRVHRRESAQAKNNGLPTLLPHLHVFGSSSLTLTTTLSAWNIFPIFWNDEIRFGVWARSDVQLFLRTKAESRAVA